VFVVKSNGSFFWCRFPRENTLLYSCACAAVTSALIPLIQRARDLWLLYVLLFLQYSAGGFYDPARRALQPTLVPGRDLGLAATLDTFAWSLMVTSWFGVLPTYVKTSVLGFGF
jgi:MFS family permease